MPKFNDYVRRKNRKNIKAGTAALRELARKMRQREAPERMAAMKAMVPPPAPVVVNVNVAPKEVDSTRQQPRIGQLTPYAS